MSDLPFKAKAYIAAIVLGAVILFLYSLPVLAFSDGPLLAAIIAFTLGIFVADLYPIRLVTDANAEVTVSCALKTAIAIALGPQPAIVVTLLGTLAAELGVRRTWYKALFNTAEMVLTTAAMSFVYFLAYDGVDKQPFSSLQNTVAVLAMVLTYLLINTGLVTTIVSLASGAPFPHVWKINFLDSLWNNLTIIPLGAVLAALFMQAPWSVLVLILPLVVVRKSFDHIAEFRRQTEQALIHMADAIDQRDPNTYEHSRRVADMAADIAQAMGLPTDEVEMVRMAGRLHDIGKIGMSNELLLKPASFSAAEFAQFQQHPVIGAQLVASFRLFEEGQHLIHHHHERYDGKGYPGGLAAEDIPLGSRILAVADSYDAMTSRRVYRPPLPEKEAIAELVVNRGTQFDPDVVDVHVAILARRQQRAVEHAQVDKVPVGP